MENGIKWNHPSLVQTRIYKFHKPGEETNNEATTVVVEEDVVTSTAIIIEGEETIINKMAEVGLEFCVQCISLNFQLLSFYFYQEPIIETTTIITRMDIRAIGTTAVMVEMAVVVTMDLKEQMVTNQGVVHAEKIEVWTEVDEANSGATYEAQVTVPTMYREENLNPKIKINFERYIFYWWQTTFN